jgi:hypothetical protein
MSASDSAGKQPYQKPSLRTIDLVAEEVMAVGCKLPAGAGPVTGGCLVPQCFNPGS